MALHSVLGVPFAVDKAEDPNTTVAFLGIELNSVNQTLSPPKPRFRDISEVVPSWAIKDAHASNQNHKVLLVDCDLPLHVSQSIARLFYAW